MLFEKIFLVVQN